MIVIEKNEGTKIPYSVSGEKITFNDDLTINLAKRQQDWPTHIDVCYDENKALVIGAAAGRAYVAEIDIPAKEYKTVEATEPMSENGETTEQAPPEALPLDMDKVVLTLWALNITEEA